jgi:pimeloyl-ACP methyl ester carboxylesterase
MGNIAGMHRHEHSFVEICGRRIEVRAIAGEAGRAPLVFLHEGLGSVAMWRGFPARVAELTGCPTFVYSRYGYGASEGLAAPFAVDYMHREAQEALPELVAKLGIEHPILVGHSDGASIALIYAGSGHPVRGLVAMAPHVFVEDLAVVSIEAAKVAFETTELAGKLARYHADARRTFYGWNDIWLDPDFRRWNIESFLGTIRCPMLAIQGRDDEYGTMAQVDAIARQVAGPCEVLVLDECGHSPHRAQHDRTLEAVAAFARRHA